MRYVKPIVEKLIDCGFKAAGDGRYEYENYNAELNMKLCVCVSADGDLSAHVYDCDTGDEYTLHNVDGAAGEFVGKVRAYYDGQITFITQNCFVGTAFICSQTQDVLDYVREKYGGEAEYLWEDTPDCCIVRRQDNRKWYLVIMTVDGKKLGLEEGTKEIINLRSEEEELDGLADGEKYFRGWHMNKRLWLTLVLDGRVAIEEIQSRIDKSYRLVGNKNKGKG